MTLTLGSRDYIHSESWIIFNIVFNAIKMILTLSFDILHSFCFQMDHFFPPLPTMQLVLRTWARDAAGITAILITLLTRLGYRWYPEYMVYEDFREFNQEQYHADVRIFP